MSLKDKICLVTGASRGIGKGIALQLGEAGATVIVTGRSSSSRYQAVGGSLQETANEITKRGGEGIAIYCDHSNDDDIKNLFDKISKEYGRLDILVNNAYSAVNALAREAKAGHKFWQHDGTPGEWWDLTNNVGLRNHYICSAYAARMMVPERSGVIVNVSSLGAKSYFFNVAYGVGKTAVDRMSTDMAIELRPYNVACVSLYPGPVMTEEFHSVISEDKDNDDANTSALVKLFSVTESAEFSGKAVVALASDKSIMSKTGRVFTTADAAREFGFTDIDGLRPPSTLQLNFLLGVYGYNRIASLIPDFVRIPSIVDAILTSKF